MPTYSKSAIPSKGVLKRSVTLSTMSNFGHAFLELVALDLLDACLDIVGGVSSFDELILKLWSILILISSGKQLAAKAKIIN